MPTSPSLGGSSVPQRIDDDEPAVPSVSFVVIKVALPPDTVLEELVRTIVEQVRPTRIVLYGSRARGDARPDSDYDLLVEVDHDDSSDGYSNRVHEIRRAIGLLGRSVDVNVHKPGQLEAQRDDPGRMAWDIAREGIIVYPANADSQVLRPIPRRDRVRENEPPDSVRDWLERAEEDLLMIERGSTGNRAPWGAVGFHAQQAAEKLLKVLLIQRGIRPERTHNLSEILQRVREAGYELPDLKAECEALKDYAVDVRYPNKLMPLPDETKGRAVLAAGRRIIDAARRHL